MSAENMAIQHHLIGLGQATTALHGLAKCLAAAIEAEEPMSGDEVEWLIMCIHERLHQHHQQLAELLLKT